MDTRDLRYFIAAAETGHLHQAAERVGRSQPALSKCIRRLENELRARLFEPSGRGIRLTAVGAALLERARPLVQGIQDTVRDIAELADGAAGHVRLGSGTTAAEWLLPSLFQQLLAQSPGLTFEVTTGLGSVLRPALRGRKLDLVITPLLDSDAAEFEAVAIGSDALVIAMRAGHPLDRPGVRAADLAGFGWLLPPDSLPSTAWLIRTLRSAGLPKPRIQVEADAVNVLRGVVMRTDLLTFLSRRDLGYGGGTRLRALDLPGLTLHRYMGALSLRGQHRAPAVERVLRLLKQIGEVGSSDRSPRATPAPPGRHPEPQESQP
jgi:DNA-binding transcriptional LysR family regulator